MVLLITIRRFHSWTSSDHHIMHDVAGDIGQAKISSLEAVREFLVIQAEQVQYGGV